MLQRPLFLFVCLFLERLTDTSGEQIVCKRRSFPFFSFLFFFLNAVLSFPESTGLSFVRFDVQALTAESVRRFQRERVCAWSKRPEEHFLGSLRQITLVKFQWAVRNTDRKRERKRERVTRSLILKLAIGRHLGSRNVLGQALQSFLTK